jgi:hypothetical protein
MAKASRIRAASGDKVDAFIDTFGGGYVDLALLAPDRIDTIIDFAAAAKHGVKTDGNSTAGNAKVLADLANLIDTGRLQIPIAKVYHLADVREAYQDLTQRLLAVRSCSYPDGLLPDDQRAGQRSAAAHRCRDLAPKIRASSPLLANSVCTAFSGFHSVILEPRDFDLDIACGGGIEEAHEAAMALGPTRRALEDQSLETRAAVATSIRDAFPINAANKLRLPGLSG